MNTKLLRYFCGHKLLNCRINRGPIDSVDIRNRHKYLIALIIAENADVDIVQKRRTAHSIEKKNRAKLVRKANIRGICHATGKYSTSDY